MNDTKSAQAGPPKPAIQSGAPAAKPQPAPAPAPSPAAKTQPASLKFAPVTTEATKSASSKSETPKIETPKIETPKIDALKTETPAPLAAKPDPATTAGTKSVSAAPRAAEAATKEAVAAQVKDTAKAAPASPLKVETTSVEPSIVKGSPDKSSNAKPALAKSSVAKAVASKPASAEPMAAKPAVSKPAVVKPVVAKPVVAKPAAAKPAAAKPAAVAEAMSEVGFTLLPKGDAVAAPLRTALDIGVENARRAYAQAQETRETLQGACARSMDAASRGFVALNAQWLDMVRAQSDAALGVWRSTISAPSVSEAVKVQTSGVRQAYETSAAHMKSIAETARRVADETAQPIRRAFDGR